MTRINATCPTCGDVELTSHQIRVVLCSVPSRSFYSFHCHTCSQDVRKSAPPDIVALLRSGGVRIEHWTIPAEALEENVGEALTNDDLLDFCLWLNDTDLVAAAAGASAPVEENR